METINEWKDLTLSALEKMGGDIASTLPNIVGAILVLILGWLITRIIAYILKKLLKVARVDRLTDKINETDIFGKTDIKFTVSKVIISFVKWILFLVFLIVAADIMNWEIVSTEIGNLMRYLPKLFSAMALFMIGIYIATFIRKAIKGLFESFEFSGSKIISNLVFYIIVVFISITALNQAGIDTTIITNNITVIFGALLLAVAIGFGLGSKEIIGDLLRTFYSRKNYMVGDRIRIDGEIEGIVEAIDNISMTLKTEKGKSIIPIKDIVEKKVDIVT